MLRTGYAKSYEEEKIVFIKRALVKLANDSTRGRGREIQKKFHN
jgi:hypothetical protein